MKFVPSIRSKARVFIAAFALALVASSARADSDAGTASTSQAANSAALVSATPNQKHAPEGAASAAKKPLDEAAAVAKIAALPEVAAVQAELDKAHVPMAIRRDDDGSSGRFEFAIAEDHDDHQVTRYRFSIDPMSGALGAYEVECDLWSPLKKWRALRKKLAAMTPAQRDAVDTCAELGQ